MRRFLTARWEDLVMVNYEVDRAILQGRVPSGTELDLDDGKCFVSLVGFMFLNTRVLGIPIPWHVNFEEVTLRFYIHRVTDGETRRGVCFVKEIVPRIAIAAVARTLYGEPYECWAMDNTRDGKVVSYSWKKGGSTNRISVERSEALGGPADGSHGSFIIEHYWGYTSRGGGRVDEYKVEHPRWEIFDVQNVFMDVDFGAVYGEEFAFLSDVKPYSTLLATGSPISVYKGNQLSL
jgi:hypothetical protein